MSVFNNTQVSSHTGVVSVGVLFVCIVGDSNLDCCSLNAIVLVLTCTRLRVRLIDTQIERVIQKPRDVFLWFHLVFCSLVCMICLAMLPVWWQRNILFTLLCIQVQSRFTTFRLIVNTKAVS